MIRKILLTWYSTEPNEAGLARNLAFKNYLEEKGYEVINFYPRNILVRFWHILKCSIILMRTKNSKVFIHGNYLITLYLIQLLQMQFYVDFLEKLIKKLAKNNCLILEINDLRYEQSLDVKTKNVTLKFVEIEKRILFEVEGAKYIFASNEMANYATQKYNLKKENVFSVINGAPYLEKKYNQEKSKISFVYAGTLNRGRQIEEVIDIFSKINSVDLYFLGVGGEWLKTIKNSGNIHYLGAFQESDAHRIVSRYDIGIIPYDENGQYYNMCYPTKASFYITAGIPFLSTPLKELVSQFVGYNSSVFVKIENWIDFINGIKLSDLDLLKSNVNSIKDKFLWEEVISKVDEIL